MAEPGDKVTRAYRGLAREEPPPALDAAILAAARESVRPRARNRWAGPVSIAAVLVLGVGVSLRMQTEQPGIETSAPPPSASSAEYPAAQSADAPAPEARAKDSPPQAPASRPENNVASAPAPRPQAKLMRDPEPPAEMQARERDSPPPELLAKKRFDEPSSPPPMVAQSAAAPFRAKREAAAGAVAQDSAKPEADERVTELERIARLRRDGKDAEADKALEEFRRRNPDYRIPEAVWERVRPR